MTYCTTSSCLCFQLGNTGMCQHGGWGITDISAATRHGVPLLSALTRLTLKVIRKGAFIGLFLAGAIGANWTDECWHFARCHSQRLKVLSCYSTTYSHTRFRFLLVQFFSALLSQGLPFALISCCWSRN
ncbi:hypothetical protein BGY98DRAFT_498733 [Russula aff. rugulosa BPL654]|nr:hypothetical protein BGY98DRAFT_498733 [Russula aff. rugulosa BPL654]